AAIRIVTHHRLARLSLMLAYIAVMAATSTWQGIRVLRARKGRRHVLDLALPLALGVGGVALAAYGIATGITPLFALFGGLGVLLAFVMVRYWVRPPKTRIDWMLEHMGAMNGAAIAALTAFAVVNASNLGLGRLSLVVWIG